MKKFYLFTAILISTIFFSQYTLAESVYFIDFQKVLNESVAGKNAQATLKKRYAADGKKYKNLEDEIKKEEKNLISQKKIITSEEYSKQVGVLRNKVAKLNVDKQKSLNGLAKLRNSAKINLQKKLVPIMTSYMKEKNIKMVVDKKSVVLGDPVFEITNIIIEILNKELKSISLK